MQQPVAPMNSTQPMVTPQQELIVGGLQKSTVDPASRIRALEVKARARALEAKESIAPEQQVKKQLPLWPDAVRAVPNALLRSSLFTVSKNREVFSKRELFASNTDIELRFMGTRLNQTDFDVWAMILHLARLVPLGSEVRFTTYSMLKKLGRNVGKAQYEQLEEEITRLAFGFVEITWKETKKKFDGVLVSKYFHDEVTKESVIVLNKEILIIYEHGYSHIDWQQRQTLKSNLAKWLHGFYASHAKAYSLKMKTLHELCGSTTKEPRKFRQMFKSALDELINVDAIKSWKINPTDLVSVDAIPTKSQQKYLNEKNKAAKKNEL